MAGSMRKMGIYLGLVEDDDEAYRQVGDEEYDDYASSESAARSAPQQREASPRRATTSSGAQLRDVALVEQSTSVEFDDYDQSYRISTLCPSTYNEALVIGENFREGSPVIMNLTEMDDTQAKRLIDFAAGLTFGLRGRLEKVTNKVFLLSPPNVDVTAEEKARIAEGMIFNQS